MNTDSEDVMELNDESNKISDASNTMCMNLDQATISCGFLTVFRVSAL